MVRVCRLSGYSGVSGLFAGGCQGPEHSPSDHSGSADVGRTGAELAVCGGAGAVAMVVAGVPADRLGAGVFGVDVVVVVPKAGVLHVVSVDLWDCGFSPGWAGVCAVASGTTPRVGPLTG